MEGDDGVSPDYELVFRHADGSQSSGDLTNVTGDVYEVGSLLREDDGEGWLVAGVIAGADGAQTLICVRPSSREHRAGRRL
jgi:hypothetical protein